MTNSSFQSRHLTIPAPAGLPLAEAAASMFHQLASTLERGIDPLQEKIYGPLADKEAVLAIRRDVFSKAGLDPQLPCTYTAGRRDEDLGLVGVQLWGVVRVADSPVRVRTVTASPGVVGRLLESPDVRMLHLSSIRGTLADGSLAPGVADQTEQMLQNAETALAEHGFGFRQVARTWIYLARILDWYGEFNRVRAEFLRQRGIAGGTNHQAFPASTGIQGTGGEEECLMDLIAVDGDADAVTMHPIKASSRQEQPIAYGSSFSRGMALRCAGEETVFVSGTASINSAGQTLHCWQREAQIVETLLSIAALLEDQGASLGDVRLATLFCKDKQTLEVYRRVTRQLGMTALPVVPVLADVCRPELMVEIEAMALVPQPAVLAQQDSPGLARSVRTRETTP